MEKITFKNGAMIYLQDLTKNEKGIRLWDYPISDYGLERGRLDYATMIKAFTDNTLILNNNIIDKVDDWELENGENEEEVYQYFIIDEHGAANLSSYTDETILYSPSLDLYLLCVYHSGTSWDYVLTEWKITKG